MPITDAVGYGDYTQQKQKDFRYVVGVHLKLVGAILEKANREGWNWKPPYWYFDITAGKGRCPETGDAGSPLIFAEEAAQSPLPCTMQFYEEVEANCDELERSMADFTGWQLFRGDHQEYLLTNLPPASPTHLGLLYCDPTKAKLPFDLLSEFCHRRSCRKIDVLLNVQGASIKRCVAVHDYPTLLESLAVIGKEVWLIRKPAGKHQWSLLLGTDNANMGNLRKHGFIRADEPEGEEYLDQLNRTNAERRGTLRLPDLRRVSEDTRVPTGAVTSHAAVPGQVRGMQAADAD